MSDKCVDVVILSADLALADLAENRRPPGLGLDRIDPRRLPAQRLPAAAQYWIDLDSCDSRIVSAPEVQFARRRVFFHTNPPDTNFNSLYGIYLQKPCSSNALDILWADVAVDEPQPVLRSSCSESDEDSAVLPVWVLDLHALDLSEFCQCCIKVLPRRLGYADIALYLHDSEQSLLTLAKTNVTEQLELAIPLTGESRHLLAAVVQAGTAFCSDDLHRSCRHRNLIVPGGFEQDRQYAALIVPLIINDDLQGVIQLTQDVPRGQPLPLPPRALFEFLARSLKNARQYLQARIEARVDRLTGLFNYRWLIEASAKEIRRAQRHQTPLSLIMLDLDELKTVNDRFGHTAGDALIRHAARKIGAALRQIDSAARVGGDEFVVLLPATELNGACRVAERILRAIRNDAPIIEDNLLPVAVSIGVAQWQKDWDQAQLLAAADRAMYTAKRAGHNRVACSACKADESSVRDTARCP